MEHKKLIDYSQPRQKKSRDWLGIFLAWFFGALLVGMTVALVNGLDVRGLL